MRMEARRNGWGLLALGLIALGLVAFGGCAPAGIKGNVMGVKGFAVVAVKKGDTTESLALTYLKDANLAWVIEEYNNLSSVRPGQKVIIPIDPPSKGGFGADKYITLPVLRYTDVSSSSGLKSHLAYLKRNGWQVVSLRDYIRLLDRNDWPRKSVAITIDSDDEDVHKRALPVLKEAGAPATIFVTTRNLGKRGHLKGDQVKELIAGGLDVQCAGHKGQGLAEPSGGENYSKYLKRVGDDLADAKEANAKAGGGGCNMLAYPDGNTSGILVALMKEKGYVAGFTGQAGGNSFMTSPYRMNRYTLTSGSSTSQLAAALKMTSNNAAE